jgi:hypothetical protein
LILAPMAMGQETTVLRRGTVLSERGGGDGIPSADTGSSAGSRAASRVGHPDLRDP